MGRDIKTEFNCTYRDMERGWAMSDRDRTAMTDPLTKGQEIVAWWETSPAATEPADLADKIDAEIKRIRAGYEAAKKSQRGAEAAYEKAEAEIERLRAALRGLLADIDDYERVNNLSPNPGRKDCWQSVTIAREALDE